MVLDCTAFRAAAFFPFKMGRKAVAFSLYHTEVLGLSTPRAVTFLGRRKGKEKKAAALRVLQ